MNLKLYTINQDFFARDIDNYFPRQLNWDVIDEKFATKNEFIKIYEEIGVKGRLYF